MRGSTLTRRLAAVVLAAVTAVVGAGITGTAASAAPAVTPVLTMDPIRPVALGPTAAQVYLSFRATTGAAADVSTTVRIDLRGLAGVADLTSPSCTVSRQLATCPDVHLSGSVGSDTAALSMILTPVKGAKLGAAGTYAVSASAVGARIVGGSGSVTVGGPDLRLAPFARSANLRVGSTVSEQVRFTNVGNRPSAGAQVLLATTPGFSFATHYRNCSYLMNGAAPWALCQFPGTIRIGESVTFTAPVTLRVGPQALYGGLQAHVMPLGDPEWTGPRGWRPGTGGVLALRVLNAGQASAAAAGRVTVDGSFDDGFQNVQLTARNTADLGVWGATASGSRGRTAPVTVGIYNHGPADIYTSASLSLIFTLPPGTTAVKVPWGCGRPNAQAAPRVYYCLFAPDLAADPSGFTIPNGAKQSYTFQLRIDTLIRHATGTVSQDPWHPFDPNPSNDSAPVVLN